MSRAYPDPTDAPEAPCQVWFSGPASALVTLRVAPDRKGLSVILDLERRLRTELPGLGETVPAFNRLLLTASPEDWDPLQIRAVVQEQAQLALGSPRILPAAAEVEIPVCYDPEVAPDLIAVASGLGLKPDTVARLHAAVVYTVLATGFSPGFAYLGDLDPRIAASRRPEPRLDVAAGSVGIADRRSGVYPSRGPGGWNLIGQAPARLFADVGERIARFEPGALVRFRPISISDLSKE